MRVRGPAVGWLVGIFVVALLALIVPGWIVGNEPIGYVDVGALWPAIVLTYTLGLLWLTDSIGRSAYKDFEPALGEAP